MASPVATPDKNAHPALRRARAAAARACVALALALGAAAGALAFAWTGRAQPVPMLLAAGLCLAWCVMMRRAPQRWRALGRDLREGGTRTIEGIAAIRSLRGIGLIAPVRHWLLVEDHRFPLDARQAATLREGSPVRVRASMHACALLAVEPLVATPGAPTNGPVAHAPGPLTPREHDLLRLLAEGCSDKEIARRLRLEPATVRTYNSALYAKLGARRRTEAIARARRLGMLTDVED